MLEKYEIDVTVLNGLNYLLRYYEEIPLGNEIVPKRCEECKYFRPNWKYRICRFSKCKYGKPVNPFRKKPLLGFDVPNKFQQPADFHESAKEVFGG